MSSCGNKGKRGPVYEDQVAVLKSLIPLSDTDSTHKEFSCESPNSRDSQSSSDDSGLVNSLEILEKQVSASTKLKKKLVGKKSVASVKPLPSSKKIHYSTSQLTSMSSSGVNRYKKNEVICQENQRIAQRLSKISMSPPKNPISFRTTRSELLPFSRIQRRLEK